MKLITINGELEVLGRNSAMKLMLAKVSVNDDYRHSTLTAPKIALQLSEPGHHGLFLLKRG